MNTEELRLKNLIKYIETNYKNKRQFCLSVQFNYGSLYSMIKGDRPFGSKLARELEEKAGLVRYSLDKESGATKEQEPEYVDIPVLDIHICAGDGSIAYEEEIVDKIPMNANWLKRRGLKKESVDFIYVDGDCMYPYLKDKDFILIDKSKALEPIKSGEIYAFYYDEQIAIKRLFIEGSIIIAKPDNDVYPTITIKKNEALVNGFRVIGLMVFRMG